MSGKRNSSISREIRDGKNCDFNENFIQWIWAQQFIRRENLQCTNRQPLEILHPGHWNKGAGPDFKKAVIRLGGQDHIVGDVEVEISIKSWFFHGHDKDFHFAHIILLVIWDISAEENSTNTEDHGTSQRFPTIALKDYVSIELTQGLGLYSRSSGLSETTFNSGRCQKYFSTFSKRKVGEILSSAGLNRLRSKSHRFQLWNHNYGSEKSLFIGIMGALGNPYNAWPMRYLAEKVIAQQDFDPESWLEAQAMLLGLSGWLPEDYLSTNRPTGQLVRELWDHWWRMRSKASDFVLPLNLWNMRQMRPLHHPQRRLALAAYLFTQQNLGHSILKWFVDLTNGGKSQNKLPVLQRMLQPPESVFWDNHYHLSSDSVISQSSSLLSDHLLLDLLMNAIGPWALTMDHPAKGQFKKELDSMVCQLIRSLPQSAENSRTRHLRQRLLGNSGVGPKGKSIFQQGLLQIEMEFCRRSDSTCSSCVMPTHLKGLANE